MKKVSLVVVCNLLLLCFAISCTQYDDNKISFTVSDSKHYYKILMHYNRSQSKDVDRYITRHFGRNNNISFINTVIDADLTLDDGTKFYMKKNPGYLSIKFNKDKNSQASLKEIKSLTEGLKPLLQHQ
jgi:hypothetical protein